MIAGAQFLERDLANIAPAFLEVNSDIPNILQPVTAIRMDKKKKQR